jgi:hypothetical protein
MYLDVHSSPADNPEMQPHPHFSNLEALYRDAQPDVESGPVQPAENELANQATGTGEETTPAHDSNPDYTVKLINERKALRHEADQLRIEALNLAIQWGVLDLFPELKKWLADAQRQGLLNPITSPDPGQTKEKIIERIGALEAHALQNDHNANTLTPEIVKDLRKEP